MYVNITAAQMLASPEINALATFAGNMAINRQWDGSTQTASYYFDSMGELLVTKDHYSLFYNNDIDVDGSKLWVVLEDSLMNTIVDPRLPLATYERVSAVNGGPVETVSRTYAEYFCDNRANKQDDGSWLCYLAPRVFGATAGTKVTNEMFRAYWALWSDIILDTKTGMDKLSQYNLIHGE